MFTINPINDLINYIKFYGILIHTIINTRNKILLYINNISYWKRFKCITINNISVQICKMSEKLKMFSWFFVIIRRIYWKFQIIGVFAGILSKYSLKVKVDMGPIHLIIYYINFCYFRSQIEIRPYIKLGNVCID